MFMACSILGSMKAKRLPYRLSVAGTLLAAREAVMAPIRPHLRKVDLTDQQWRVLRVLVDEGATDASGLAEAGLLYPPTVTRILKQLADRGYLIRKPDPDDGRRLLVSATPKGRALVEKTAAHVAVLLAEYDRCFGAKRLQALQVELAALAASIVHLSDAADRHDD